MARNLPIKTATNHRCNNGYKSHVDRVGVIDTLHRNLPNENLMRYSYVLTQLLAACMMLVLLTACSSSRRSRSEEQPVTAMQKKYGENLTLEKK